MRINYYLRPKNAIFRTRLSPRRGGVGGGGGVGGFGAEQSEI